ncbi:hypothetical protein SVI_1848 [Shewanella violacea DSS12]|uniref:Uncharacterized protein n=1 Tax=Shewanella violacea (strain JCM 10179 / CIP 106290 / LMG 19151 / DSS12) TaxID=637905 RepID=D4ZJH0_SHEVD|nr:hypothetical protein SVI_1848 [Shewanella violacea DSS12]
MSAVFALRLDNSVWDYLVKPAKDKYKRHCLAYL